MKTKMDILEFSKSKPQSFFAVLLGEGNTDNFSGNGKVKKMREADSLGRAKHYATAMGRNSWIIANGEIFPN